MIQDIIQNKKLLIVGGSGGVGKTTTAAAIALQVAQLGKKVIVLTIDPAKRLANSLGLSNLDHKPQSIDISTIIDDKKSKLDAMMLDTKSTFDKLITKYADDQEKADRILNNPLYLKLSNIIVGSQEYMAMEKLYELWEEDQYDFMVIDTPPTVHAIDFLEAPQKMVNAIDKSMVKLLLKPTSFLGRSGFKLLETGSQMVLKVLDKIIGGHFMDQVSELVIAFQELLSGFQDRADQVYQLLKSEEVGFLVVGACEKQSIDEIEFFSEKLKNLELDQLGIILNRVHQDYGKISKSLKDEISKKDSKLYDEVMKVYQSYLDQLKYDEKLMERINGFLESDQFFIKIPFFEKDIHDLKSLDQLGKVFV